MELMAFDRAQPLYASVIQRILRDMRLTQQEKPGNFNYREFITKLEDEPLSPDQKRGLRQRLDTLQSFMVADQIKPFGRGKSAGSILRSGTDWTPKVSCRVKGTLPYSCLTNEVLQGR